MSVIKRKLRLESMKMLKPVPAAAFIRMDNAHFLAKHIWLICHE